MVSNVQASDIADGSMNHEFLSKYMMGGGVKAMPTVDSPLTTYSDKPIHAKAHTQDTMIAANEEDTDVQKLLSNESNKPVGFSASVVAVALLSLAAMVGVRMRKRMKRAIALAGSSEHGVDMSIPLASLSADINNSCVPWDPLGLGESATKTHVKNLRGSELQHGQVATIAVFFVSLTAAGNAKHRRQRAPTSVSVLPIGPDAMVKLQKATNKAEFEETVAKYAKQKRLSIRDAELEYATYLLDPDQFVLQAAAKDKGTTQRTPERGSIKKAAAGQRRSALLQAYIDEGGPEVEKRISDFERTNTFKALGVIAVFSFFLLADPLGLRVDPATLRS
jgi:hypothetical protein